jgi:D-serine dehydratase
LGRAKLDWRCKGLPARAEGLTGAEIGALGLSLTGSDMMMPVAILRDEALRHNIAAMQAFADGIGARLAPHGKTSMSPELFAMQMEAGAWGLTAATAHHVRAYRRLGIPRIFLANQLVSPTDIAGILAELARDPDFDFYCLVDSPRASASLPRRQRQRERPGRCRFLSKQAQRAAAPARAILPRPSTSAVPPRRHRPGSVCAASRLSKASARRAARLDRKRPR